MESGKSGKFPHARPHRLAPSLWHGCRIGILGGSFNPAHDGHLYISQLAIKLFDLDQVWWMVSPQNPLKSANGMAPLADRMASAERLVTDQPRILVTSIEGELGTRYTADTLAKLHRHFPGTDFVWLMGSDNLIQIPQWRDWEAIFRTTPVAVLTRTSYAMRVLNSKAARRFRSIRVGPNRLKTRFDRPEARRISGWTYVLNLPHPASATAIRRATHWPTIASDTKIAPVEADTTGDSKHNG